MIKLNSCIASIEKALVVWIEDQISHNNPLSQSVIQGQIFQFYENWEAKKLKKFKSVGGGSCSLKKEAVTIA